MTRGDEPAYPVRNEEITVNRGMTIRERFTSARALSYHRSVGEMCRKRHAIVAYGPNLSGDYLAGLAAFIEGVNSV